MSYALAFALDAQIDWRKLDVPIQEIILDELDRLAAAAPPTIIGVPFVHDFVHYAAGMKHSVFLYLYVSSQSQTVHVLSVGEFVEPTPKGLEAAGWHGSSGAKEKGRRGATAFGPCEIVNQRPTR